MVSLRVKSVSGFFTVLTVLAALIATVMTLPMLAAASGSSIYPEDSFLVDGATYRPARFLPPFGALTHLVSQKRKASVPFYAFGGKRDGSPGNYYVQKPEIRGRSYFAWGGKRSDPSMDTMVPVQISDHHVADT